MSIIGTLGAFSDHNVMVACFSYARAYNTETYKTTRNTFKHRRKDKNMFNLINNKKRMYRK